MDILFKTGTKPTIEYLVFEKEGRPHQHPDYESFFVFSGHGQVISGEQTFQVAPGSLVTIPPKTSHWMIPNEGESLVGFLWYHQHQLNCES